MGEISSSGGTAAPVLPPLPVRFTGSGGAYFGIWIVNVLLTILTIGIYSSWAKVRRLRYFYRHTELADSSFDFHGSPGRILLGRVVALAMFLVYNYFLRMRSPWTLLVLALFLLVLPWLLRNSFRFRLYNTSWRNTRFHFRGSVAGAYRVVLLNGVLTLMTLYMLAPFTHQRLKAYQHNSSYFGRARFSFHATAGQFYLVYLLLLVSAIVLFSLLGAAGVGSVLMALGKASQQRTHVDARALVRSVFLLYGVLILYGLLIGPIFHALLTNLIWNNTRLEEHRIECRLSPLPLMWIGVSNLVVVALTLGLFMPWASVRLAKYQAECMRLLPATDLQEFVDTEPEKVGAVGEEAMSMFDFDIAL